MAYRSKVVGIVLTGYLDDGTSGMIAIKRCGGTCVVQDPLDAAYPDMPQNVLNQLEADHVVPLAEMGALLTKLLKRPVSQGQSRCLRTLAIEARIAERVLSDLPSVESGWRSSAIQLSQLWRRALGGRQGRSAPLPVPHGPTPTRARVLLVEQTAKIEETLWIALRMFEERRNLLTTMSDRKSRGFSPSAAARAKESEVHINRIRAMLKADTTQQTT